MSGFFGGGGGAAVTPQSIGSVNYKRRQEWIVIDIGDNVSDTLPVLGTVQSGSPGAAPTHKQPGDANVGNFWGQKAGAGTSAGAFYNKNLRVGRNITATLAVSFGGATNLTFGGRYWFGLWDQTGGISSGITTDNAAGNYAMVRFSVGVDTTFKFVTKDNVTQNIIDTGITPNQTTEYFFTFQENTGTNWTLSNGGTLVATSSSNLPGAVYMAPCISCHNPTGGSVAEINIHQYFGESDR